LTPNAPQLLEGEATLAFFTPCTRSACRREGQTALASQAQVGAQAGTQAGAEIRAQTQAEAQAQAPRVNVRPTTAQPSAVAWPLLIYGAPPDSHLNLPSQLALATNRHLERRLEALQHSLNSQTGPLHLQQPHYALSASLPSASVPAPLQSPVELPLQSFLNTQGESQIFEIN
jgi:hypothetical protein